MKTLESKTNSSTNLFTKIKNMIRNNFYAAPLFLGMSLLAGCGNSQQLPTNILNNQTQSQQQSTGANYDLDQYNYNLIFDFDINQDGISDQIGINETNPGDNTNKTEIYANQFSVETNSAHRIKIIEYLHGGSLSFCFFFETPYEFENQRNAIAVISGTEVVDIIRSEQIIEDFQNHLIDQSQLYSFIRTEQNATRSIMQRYIKTMDLDGQSFTQTPLSSGGIDSVRSNFSNYNYGEEEFVLVQQLDNNAELYFGGNSDMATLFTDPTLPAGIFDYFFNPEEYLLEGEKKFTREDLEGLIVQGEFMNFYRVDTFAESDYNGKVAGIFTIPSAITQQQTEEQPISTLGLLIENNGQYSVMEYPLTPIQLSMRIPDTRSKLDHVLENIYE